MHNGLLTFDENDSNIRHMNINKKRMKIYKVLFLIIFQLYYYLRPSKNKYLYIYDIDSSIYKSILIFTICFISYCLWTHQVSFLILYIIISVFLLWLKNSIPINDIILAGYIEYINKKLKTNKIRFDHLEYANCLTYDGNIIILENGLFNNKNEQCVVMVSSNGKLLDKFMYINVRHNKLGSRSFDSMNKMNIMGCNNDDVKKLLIQLDQWITIQNPAKSILNHMNKEVDCE